MVKWAEQVNMHGTQVITVWLTYREEPKHTWTNNIELVQEIRKEHVNQTCYGQDREPIGGSPEHCCHLRVLQNAGNSWNNLNELTVLLEGY
jgi:hypothetical protein